MTMNWKIQVKNQFSTKNIRNAKINKQPNFDFRYFSVLSVRNTFCDSDKRISFIHLEMDQMLTLDNVERTKTQFEVKPLSRT